MGFMSMTNQDFSNSQIQSLFQIIYYLTNNSINIIWPLDNSVVFLMSRVIYLR